MFFFSCSQNYQKEISYAPIKKIIPLEKKSLNGTFTSLKGESTLLTQYDNQPLVLMFVGFFCWTCVEEVESLKASLSNSIPKNIKFLSILIEEDPEVGQEWQEEHQVPWTVGTDPNGDLFDKYCQEPTTPCIILFDPQKGIVLRKTGKVSVDQIKSLLGDWS